MEKRKILNYFNKGVLTRADIFTSMISNKISLRSNAKNIFKFNIENTNLESLSSEKQFVSSEYYNGNNNDVKKMITFITKELSNDLIGAYVHGSLGTNGKIPYSDFDALVILKDIVFESQKRIAYVAEKLIKAKKIMYKMDPLQHHGWFILTESDLKNYPQTYFPHELFEYAKTLFPDKETKLEIYLNKNGYDYIQPFHNLANSIIKKIESGKLPKSMYRLKGLLSEFMLLPALYVQAREKRGVYKKFSFDLARKDFSIKDWEIMDEVSEIRINWHYKMGPLKRKLFTITNPAYRKFITRYLSPKIPNDIKIKLTSEFYKSMKELCEIMSSKI